MNTLNAEALIKHITSKQAEYRKRRDAAKLAEDEQAVGDYTIRLLPLDNLLLRISRGDFDMITLKKEPEPEETVEEKSGVEVNES